MPSVCDCPYCGQPTAIPEDLDSDTEVRCPLCHYEFPGDRALMYAVEAPPDHIADLPPALVPIRPAGDTVSPQEIQPAEDAVSPQESEPKEAQEPAAQDGNGVPTNPDVVTEQAATESEPLQAMAQEAAPTAITPLPAAEPSPASGSAEVGAAESAFAPEQKPSESGEPSPIPVSTETAPVAPETTPDAPFGQPSPAWRERRKRSPVLTAIGIVVSGLLGLAVPYGAWLGLSKLGFWGNAKQRSAEAENGNSEAKSAKQEPSLTPPPDPKSFDEWPGIDENRFTGAPKEAPKNVQPSGPPKKGTSGSGMF